MAPGTVAFLHGLLFYPEDVGDVPPKRPTFFEVYPTLPIEIVFVYSPTQACSSSCGYVLASHRSFSALNPGRSCKIRGGRSGNGAGSPRFIGFPLVLTIPPLLNILRLL
jgi:hypothetical protein